MRRLSLALAMIGAVAAGCSMSGPAASGSGTAEGVQGEYYYVNLFTPPVGGYITSDVGGINCGAASVTVNNAVTPPQYTYTWIDGTRSACGTTGQTRIDWAQTVVLTATPAAGKVFFGWAGDCKGIAATCTLTAGADKTVVALFGVAGQAHVGFEDGAVHGPAAIAYASSTADALDCAACHGETFQGQGIAPACSSCHSTHFDLGTGFTTGPAVSKLCVKCHTGQADDLLGTVHFKWTGSSTTAGSPAANSIGKRNLINNFCVANASNEARCMQCHPSYSVAPTKDATGAVQVNTGPMYNWLGNPAFDKSKIDCLICHADLGTSKYVKAAAPFGAPSAAIASCFPACSGVQTCSPVDSAGAAWPGGGAYCIATTSTSVQTAIGTALTAAANSVGETKRANCGFCHFGAGGGDNVKMGDLGSALKAPTQAVDVHMGSTASYAPQTCAKCHAGSGHTIKGSNLVNPLDSEGRLECTSCHSGLHVPAHPAGIVPHLDFIACQTCHIPAFSRTQPTKIHWDWSSSGDKQACRGVAGCIPFGSLTYPAGAAQTGAIAGVGGEANKVAIADPGLGVTAASWYQTYDWKKGIATWGQGVVPTYQFMAPKGVQQGTHETTAKNGMLGAGTPEDPFRLASPLPPPAPVLAGWKISPFKKMTGRTPAFIDDSAMVVPRLFGNDSLWAADMRGFPMVPNNLGSAANAWDQAKVDAIWTAANNYGAALGGQLGTPVAKSSVAAMTRDAAHLITVTTQATLPATLPATLFLVGDEAAFPSGVKAVTRIDDTHFSYTETIPYTVNTGVAALPVLPATSTKPVTFFNVLTAAQWKWANTVMYIDINHEVAPVDQALSCSSCHPLMGGTIETSRMRELYNLGTGAGQCADPSACSKR